MIQNASVKDSGIYTCVKTGHIEHFQLCVIGKRGNQSQLHMGIPYS